MIQQDTLNDFVPGTGESHTFREFAEEALKVIGKKLIWTGNEVNEVGLFEKGIIIVNVSKEYFRPLESDNYRADYTNAKQ